MVPEDAPRSPRGLLDEAEELEARRKARRKKRAKPDDDELDLADVW